MEQCAWCGKEMLTLKDVRRLVLDTIAIRVCATCTAERWNTLTRFVNELRSRQLRRPWGLKNVRFDIAYHRVNKWSWEE